MKPPGAREAALRALRATVEQQRYLDDAVAEATQALADARERALARELAFGVCRFMPRLEAIRDGMLEHPLKRQDRDIGLVLLLGLYQSLYTRIPAHAAVSETVGLVDGLHKRWARGLVNALLRRFERERDARLARADASPSALYAHPTWLLEALREAWPERWLDIVAANNCAAPLTLRVNRRRQSVAGYLQRLASTGLAGTRLRHAPDGVVLDGAVEVDRLPGFGAGEVSVQDEAAQLAAGLMDLRPGQRVLDACAAPGGKTAHMLELEPALSQLVAVDKSPQRLRLLSDNLSRLGLAARLIDADARAPNAWWDGTAFDRILIDAPCSATGVIRRHPDVKVRRRPADVVRSTELQLELLHSLWPLLARGGLLLYATCSVMPAENAQLTGRFLDARRDASALPITACWGVAAGAGRQLLPGACGMDGFYYALLAKR